MWLKSIDTYHNYEDIVDFHLSMMHTESNMSGNAICRRYEITKSKKSFDFSLDQLGAEDYQLDILLVEALSKRRTSWQFGNEYTINHLSKLLKLSLGVTSKMMYGEHLVQKKAYASAGAEYVVKPYLITNHFGNELLDNQILEYDSEREMFRRIGTTNHLALNSICSMTKFTEQNLTYAKCTIFLVADLNVLFSKYGKLSYKLALLEAGHICQNLQMVAASLGLNSVPLGGFYDDYVKQLLKLEQNEFCLYILATG